MRPKTRSRMSPTRTRSTRESTPSRGPSEAAETATVAGYTNIFDGTQPTLMQVPPKTRSSQMAMDMPAVSLPGMELPEPVPMIARSK